MSIEINQSVVTGMPTFPVDPSYSSVMPKIAAPACLSDAEPAPWTNRVPAHEPWPRTLMGDHSSNSPNMEHEYNTSHNPQFVDDHGGQGSKSINHVEGTDVLPRGRFWRR